MIGSDIVGARDDARRIGRAGRLGRYVLRKDGNGGNGEKGGEDEAHGVTPDFCASVIARLAVPAKAIFAEFPRSEEHTSELQSLLRISYAVFCLTKKNTDNTHHLSRR